jgi:hypothetical protein
MQPIMTLRILIATTCSLLTASALAAPQKCSIPGEVLHWVADFCMYSAETDDFANPEVQKCFAKQPNVPAAAACKTKLKYKRGLCEIAVRNGIYEKSVGQCVRDKSFSGSTVHNGGL